MKHPIFQVYYAAFPAKTVAAKLSDKEHKDLARNPIRTKNSCAGFQELDKVDKIR